MVVRFLSCRPTAGPPAIPPFAEQNRCRATCPSTGIYPCLTILRPGTSCVLPEKIRHIFHGQPSPLDSRTIHFLANRWSERTRRAAVASSSMFPGTAKVAQNCGRSAIRQHVASSTRTASLAPSTTNFSTRAQAPLKSQRPSVFSARASSNRHDFSLARFTSRNYSKSLAVRDDTDLDGPISFEELKSLASQKTTPLSLQNMYKYASVGKPAQRLRNAQFLHKELPIRIAQRAIDLLTLPHGLGNSPQVRSVANVYLKYLAAMLDFPCPQSAEEEQRFTDTLRPFILDRTSIPAAVAAGISTLKDRRKEENLDVRRLREMEDALYRFFTARVGLRFLSEHHILSDDRNQEQNDEFARKMSLLENVPLDVADGTGDTGEGFMGCIAKNCDPVREAKRVADQVSRHCQEAYGLAPDIDIVDCTERSRFARRDFTYVPHHLQYMLSELLKNSCRASVRK